ncbi:hypothetical protein B0H67DRAFT_584996 [Lasiosphaeris hirsuta]|uniref:Secreted protein n=1 Tax=Lasiosphaeris hirsuta TaxID=260670 RepID=A0AA40A8L4_9PEZI|nr:hypothetical protein B0H67DRAFT_584996 [Lasiosphaeris hirsuta]
MTVHMSMHLCILLRTSSVSLPVLPPPVSVLLVRHPVRRAAIASLLARTNQLADHQHAPPSHPPERQRTNEVANWPRLSVSASRCDHGEQFKNFLRSPPAGITTPEALASLRRTILCVRPQKPPMTDAIPTHVDLPGTKVTPITHQPIASIFLHRSISPTNPSQTSEWESFLNPSPVVCVCVSFIAGRESSLLLNPRRGHVSRSRGRRIALRPIPSLNQPLASAYSRPNSVIISGQPTMGQAPAAAQT